MQNFNHNIQRSTMTVKNFASVMLLFRYSLLASMLAMLSACASMLTDSLAHDLQKGMANQDDPAIVRDGAPAYMLLIDGNIQSKPDDKSLLLAGARLYATYASVFVEDKARAQTLSSRARNYARRAICLVRARLCQIPVDDFKGFVQEVNTFSHDDLGTLYTYATAWAGWVITHKDDWNAIADLPKIEVLLRRVVKLDDAYEQGMPHVYLGMLDARLPASMGGKPEQARHQFEHAIQISSGRNLMAKVYMAKSYARLVFDRKLHDSLLHEVLKADPHQADLTLSNVLAQEQARQLLKSAAEYF